VFYILLYMCLKSLIWRQCCDTARMTFSAAAVRMFGHVLDPAVYMYMCLGVATAYKLIRTHAVLRLGRYFLPCLGLDVFYILLYMCFLIYTATFGVWYDSWTMLWYHKDDSTITIHHDITMQSDRARGEGLSAALIRLRNANSILCYAKVFTKVKEVRCTVYTYMSMQDGIRNVNRAR
jgi:hypothetical protein